MSGQFDDSSNPNYIVMSAGGTGAAGTGAYTMATLWCPKNLTTFHQSLGVSLYASATQTRAIGYDFSSSKYYGTADFSSGFGGPAAADTWYLIAQSKPAGSAHYRFHAWTYDSGGAGSMSHGESTGAANHGDGSSITDIRVGHADTATNGLIAAVGVWTSELSDGQLDTLVSIHFSAWAALSPAALISLESWNGSTGCTDVIGSSTQSSITGTVGGSGANPPSFDFTAGSGATVTLGPSRTDLFVHS